jgi:cephalosporin-C deacetylase-like acetyl esterase
MPDPTLPQAFDALMRARGQSLRAQDQPPATLAAWQTRRQELRRAMLAAMGPMPDKPCALEPRVLGTLKRPGYRIEKLVFQSRPDVWVTGSLYLPDPARQARPAVLAVHGHWAGARRDPVVQARCLGLVHLGFVVFAVDAFGAGERFTRPAPGTYHGALYGSTLWPSGQTLLGMQVYDNRRAVDYLCSRPEVDPRRLGITGASGGGNQSMNAGALDDRLGAVVPVCSVGTYQAYLRAACCVCELLPGALRFTEEGDVLALVAPRALMVINATRDAFQFSVEEARISLQRARAVYELHKVPDKVRHTTFDSGHAYSQPMREAMYGWMTRWLKNEGKGKPIAEPKHEIDKPEDLACYPDGKRPANFLLLPEYAARAARPLLERANAGRPDHREAWESTAMDRRSELRRVLGEFPPRRANARPGTATTEGMLRTLPVVIEPEPNMPLPALWRARTDRAAGAHPACLLLHLEGKQQAVAHPLAAALLERGWSILAPDLRATGATRPANDAIAGAPDHNSAEHALWVGRPLLGQWTFDASCLLDWIAAQPNVDRQRLSVVGIGPAGLVALCAAALFDDRVASAGAIGQWASYVTTKPYPAGTSMGVLAPGILHIGDVPHLAALAAPRRLLIAEARTPQNRALGDKDLRDAFAFPRNVYRVLERENALALQSTLQLKEAVAALSASGQ